MGSRDGASVATGKMVARKTPTSGGGVGGMRKTGCEYYCVCACMRVCV